MHKQSGLLFTRILFALALFVVAALIVADSHLLEDTASEESEEPSQDVDENGLADEGATNNEEVAEVAIDPVSIEAGAILAADNCTACHGEDGNTNTPAWGNIAGQNARYLYQQLVLIKSKSREIAVMNNVMEEIDDDGMRSLAMHYASLSGRIGQADPGKDLELGRKIYRGGILEKEVAACTACHGPSGNGNLLAGFPRISGQPVEYLENQLKAYREGERTSDEEYGGMMRDIAEKLTDSEISAVANYMTGLY